MTNAPKGTAETPAPLTAAERSLFVHREIEIDAPADAVFAALLAEMNDFNDDKGNPMRLKLEAWPGGRWFRDLGNSAGHLWGHVQVIKPPMLLEITGPLMISAPVINHLSYRISQQGNGCVLSLKHRGIGEIDERLSGGLQTGWQLFVDRVRARAGAAK